MHKNKLQIAIIGYGKMGKIIEELAIYEGHTIVLKCDSSNPLQQNIDILDKVDVAIEFTSPEAVCPNLKLLAEHKIPTVCGSTGWLERYDEIKQGYVDNNNTAFLYASNFSIGVNVFFIINKKLAEIMNRFTDYDISIYESHHIGKKDAPSGTAVTIAQQIVEKIDWKSGWEKEMPSDSEKIAIRSHREGDVKGLHEVFYRSSIDLISIRHEAFNRKGFAMGALLAAEWIIGKNGIFQMEDVLDIT